MCVCVLSHSSKCILCMCVCVCVLSHSLKCILKPYPNVHLNPIQTSRPKTKFTSALGDQGLLQPRFLAQNRLGAPFQRNFANEMHAVWIPNKIYKCTWRPGATTTILDTKNRPGAPFQSSFADDIHTDPELFSYPPPAPCPLTSWLLRSRRLSSAWRRTTSLQSPAVPCPPPAEEGGAPAGEGADVL